MSRLVTDATWATMTLYMEAGEEPFLGMVAVGEVIVNRMARRWFSDGTVTGTCLYPLQFSCWNGQSRQRPRAAVLDESDLVVQRCQRAWQMAVAGSQVTQGAVAYYNPALVTPPWAQEFVETVVIGNHRFGTLQA